MTDTNNCYPKHRCCYHAPFGFNYPKEYKCCPYCVDDTSEEMQ